MRSMYCNELNLEALPRSLDDILTSCFTRAERRRWVHRGIANITPMMERAFARPNILVGWKRAGMIPLNNERILDKCPLWRKVWKPKDRTKVLEMLPFLSARFVSHGRLIVEFKDEAGAGLSRIIF